MLMYNTTPILICQLFFSYFSKKSVAICCTHSIVRRFSRFFLSHRFALGLFLFYRRVRFSFCALRLFAKIGTRKNKKAAKALTIFECPLLTVRNTCDKIKKAVLACPQGRRRVFDYVRFLRIFGKKFLALCMLLFVDVKPCRCFERRGFAF